MRRAALVVLAALVLVAPAPSRRADAVAPHVSAVGAIAVTVASVERSITFYSDVLGFEKVSDVEVWSGDWERLLGVAGLRLRVVGMRLGDERIELMEYLTPRGRPIPADSRSHDRWSPRRSAQPPGFCSRGAATDGSQG